MPIHSTPLTEEKPCVKGSLTPILGENSICAKDIPKLAEWPTFSGEGQYNHNDFIRKIYILQEDFHIPDEIIVGNVHSFFIINAKKWYYEMRQDHGKHDWPWWKLQIISKWANNSWRFKMENPSKSVILTQKTDMSESMINMRILIKGGGELEHAIKCRCVEPC
ncbi:hypothetical protein O181_099482 [Austropuccinia psidii MF-1]|uniref:Uncharacterized protein n=1 Tax=Austropuccinia psidii MF-1 TaxID=1389203 RepID=A0A9Q3JCC8_9BASI|nr:hypothetical protein [Austropuccinia psidii MF-1]